MAPKLQFTGNCTWKVVDGIVPSVMFRCHRSASYDVVFHMSVKDVLEHERHGAKRYVNAKGTIIKCPECHKRCVPEPT